LDHHPVILGYLLFNPLAVITTQTTTILIFFLILLAVISFFISGAQVAYFSLTTKDMNMLKTKQQPNYKRIVDLLEEPKILLASLIIANTIINIGIIVIANYVINEIVPLNNQLAWVEFLIKVLSITLLLVMFAEVMPKVMATQNSIRFAKDSGALVEAVFYIFSGLSKRIVESSDYIEKKLSNKATASYNLDELDNPIDIRADETTSEKEKNILKGIVKFGNITVKQIMRARLDVSGISYETSFGDVIKRVEELHYSRLPVYKNDLDEVVGMIHTKDLLPYLDLPDYDWHLLIRPPYFIHEQKMIEDLLGDFRTKRTHFAIVVDEFGGTSGIVTLEDIMEEIIGDIRDEFDEEDISFKKLDDYTFLFDGKTAINDVCKAIGLSSNTFDSVRGDSDSLAGLVLEITGEIPKQEQVIQCGDFEFTVVDIEKNRLQKIKVAIKPQLQA
jgi:putative hemolysin